MNVLMEPIKRAALIDEIVGQLERLVADGRLKEGDRLPSETDLARQLGVGRGTVREALIVLETRKLVTRSRRGTVVTNSSHREALMEVTRQRLIKLPQMQNLLEARKVLEIELSALCASRCTDDDVSEMAECVARMAGAQERGDIEAFASADTEFHMLLAQGARNEVLAAMLEIARDLLVEATRELVQHDEALRRRAVSHHQAILECVRKEDPAGARAAAAAHLADVTDAMARFRSRN
ncbi:MAG: FCD domain-containing protein [Bacillota bacterium]